MAFRMLSFPALVRMQAQAVQSSSGRIVNFGVGSAVLALLEANAGVALWMQWLMVLLLRRTRASSSQGTDLDTWMADFGVVRMPAVAATGTVTFGRLSLGMASVIAVGTAVRTGDGQTVFMVTADPTNLAWNGTGYAIGATTPTITVPVTALVLGAAGNVQAGTVSLLSSAVAGIDTVVNTAPMVGGYDPESDPALRVRFVLFINSRARATVSAVAYAITSYQQGLSYAIAENKAPDGSVRQGYFTVAIDDGSGTPPAALLASVYAAIDVVRPLGTSFSVVAPVLVPVTVSMVITAAPGYAKASLIGPVATTIVGYIDALTIGVAMPYSRLTQLAYSVPGVANVQAVTLNGLQLDVGGAPAQVVRTTLTAVAVN